MQLKDNEMKINIIYTTKKKLYSTFPWTWLVIFFELDTAWSVTFHVQVF